jgi:cob(I)alamin adenosyltransferase
MSHLSAIPEARADYPGLSGEDVVWLEDQITYLEAALPELKGFVLPGDSPAGAACQMARTIVRRAERRLVALSEQETDIGAANLAFVNRLSSLMFVAALYENQHEGHALTFANQGA